ncbi:MAG: NADH-quinone oxidoreductase subunit F [Candidatus Syntrophonatronum acetioxidans]|uniref:NADH-quinone oxidoreductase subunit F n=1 Tax=Candidatus Syntrophonatronum acetioxidans TaxID=1795816 RepID=A0A424YHE9_9FIRM|nr:MAG: NADH-quinone oxidoreductase subunit F [Candidatus Syntrophonatronum acetioxidans]
MASPPVSIEKLKEMKNKALEKINSLQEKTVVMVGTATCGKAAGAIEVREALKKEIESKGLDAQVIEVGCMGHCYPEPLIVISKPGFPALCYGDLDEGLAKRLVNDFLIEDDPCFDYALVALEPNEYFPAFTDFPRGVYEKKIILEKCGFIDPEDIDHYLAKDGYEGLAKSLEMDPEEVIAIIKDSKLRGRGGAGFPAGVKWEICRSISNDNNIEKYVICNADEGDPGAFMDRSILESNPHQVIEGLIIAGYAGGASRGYVYVRSEYPQAVRRVQTAIEQAREKNLLGNNILGSDFSFDIEIFEGSGAFVCGEETAMINSMEGKMGVPEHRPPFPASQGFRLNPTIINNVKTLSYVPYIIKEGADWFKSIGTEDSPGTAVFALAGKIGFTGLVEVPMGTSLQNLIYDVGGGVPQEKKFKAVQIGGPSGGCLPEGLMDSTIDFDSLQKAGAIMGSGGLVVLNEDDCMVEIARYFLDFTQKESCGLCTFCRLGTKHMLDILEKITRGKGDYDSLKILQELAEDVKKGSLCGLGKTAPNPVLTTLRYFEEEYKAHIEEGRCPALMCKELIAFYILPEKCSKLCSACVGPCPTDAIYTRDDGLKAIDQEKCVKCNSCLVACPPEYNAVIKLSPPELVEEKERENS